MIPGAPILLPDQFNAATYFIDRHIQEGRGEKIAIEAGEARVSYRQLWESVNRFGNALRQLGVRIEERVFLLLLDTPEFAFSFFGAIKIGAVPVPVNTLLKTSDYHYILNNSRARVAVVSEALYPQLQGWEKLRYLQHVIVVGGAPPATTDKNTQSFADLIEQNSPQLEAEPTSKDDAAFWLYSSGSTGFPKACVHLQHDMVVCAERYARGILGMTESDRCFSVAKLFFAYGLGNALYFPLAVGATSILWPGPPRPQHVFEIIERHRPSLFFSVPSNYAALLAHEGKTTWGRTPSSVLSRQARLLQTLTSPQSAMGSPPAKPCPRPCSIASRNASAWKFSTPSAPPKSCTCSSPTARARSAPAPAARSFPATRRRLWTKTTNLQNRERSATC